MKNLKKELLNSCSDYLNNKISKLKVAMEEIQQAANLETKSSAGDKFETGRAMMHLEKEKYALQLAELYKMQETLSRIDAAEQHEKATLGSIVYTNAGNYFLSISAGKIKVFDQQFFAISALAPIGKLLLGKAKGVRCSFREKEIIIQELT